MLNINDYEKITLVMDDIRYELRKENIGFTLDRVDKKRLVLWCKGEKHHFDKINLR